MPLDFQMDVFVTEFETLLLGWIKTDVERILGESECPNIHCRLGVLNRTIHEALWADGDTFSNNA